MSDAEPYTKQEASRLNCLALELAESGQAARLIATVEALTEARAEVERLRKMLPAFQDDCDRECWAPVQKAGHSCLVRHSPFCKHAKPTPLVTEAE